MPALHKLMVINLGGDGSMNEKKILDQMVGSNIQRERIKAGFTQEKFSVKTLLT